MDLQRYDEASPASIRRIIGASHQALGLLITPTLAVIVIIALLLSRGNGRLGWRR